MTGYGDIYPESNAAKILTSIIVLLGFSLIPAQVSKRKGRKEEGRGRGTKGGKKGERREGGEKDGGKEEGLSERGREGARKGLRE